MTNRRREDTTFLQILRYSTMKQKKGCEYSAYRLKYIYEVEREKKEEGLLHCRVHIRYLVFFVTCSGRVSVTFFLFENSDCSRLGTLLFPLVFGFRKMISVGCLLMDPFFISRCHLFFPAKDGCGTYCVLCITSVDFVCSVRGVA